MLPSSQGPEGHDAWGTSRHSRLFPGRWLVHADLHNHTWLSDGAGDPSRCFASMRAAGLDVAAITDHSRWASAFLGLVGAPGWTGIDGRAWRQTASLADAANLDGEFVALRGFEWSHAAFGHMNVWGTQHFTDPLRTFPTMGRFWRWLERHGDDGLVTFNHPGTGRLRFSRFGYRPALAERLVGLEIFNKTDEYLFKDTDRAGESPLNQCLNAGWRMGLLVVVALTSLGAASKLAEDRPAARMGTAVAHSRGPVRIQVDLDRGERWWGRRLNVQVLRPGRRLPTLAAALDVCVPSPDEPVIAFEVDLDPGEGDWLVLRVSDPSEPADSRATGQYARLGRGIAYTSPFWLEPPPKS